MSQRIFGAFGRAGLREVMLALVLIVFILFGGFGWAILSTNHAAREAARANRTLIRQADLSAKAGASFVACLLLVPPEERTDALVEDCKSEAAFPQVIPRPNGLTLSPSPEGGGGVADSFRD